MVIYILDASAFLAGVSLQFEGDMLIPSAVDGELATGTGRKRIEESLLRGARIVSPPADVVERISEKANAVESGRLSEADVSVVALAVEYGGIVVSDDYGIQNLCKVLDIKFQPLAEGGIKEEWKWRPRCAGCGRWFDEEHKECPICGSAVKPKRVR